MHELIDALAMLADTLLTPFVHGEKPRALWHRIAGITIASIGMIAVLGLTVLAFYWATRA